MKKILLYTMVSMFSCFCFANNELTDPCEEIVGNWTGTFNTSNCRWEVAAQGTRYNENVRLQMTLTGGNCDDNTWVLSGTCVESNLELVDLSNSKLTGTIYGGFMYLHEGPYSELLLNKTS